MTQNWIGLVTRVLTLALKPKGKTSETCGAHLSDPNGRKPIKAG